MPRTINGSLQTKLTAGTTNLCHLVVITRTDGTIFRYTDLDQDLTVDGDLYESSDSFVVSAITSSANNGIQSTNCKIFFSAAGFTEIDVAKGAYDSADVEFSVVDYVHPEWDKMILLTGKMSSVDVTNRKVGQFEMSGLLSVGDAKIGEYYSPECRANLGDARCGIDVATTEATGTVIDAEGYRHKFVASLDAPADDHIFDGGILTFTSGANVGIPMEIQNQIFIAAYFINLAMQLPNAIEAGDTFTMSAGCDKRPITCLTKFDNIVNFRGEPFVPGSDYINDLKLI